MPDLERVRHLVPGFSLRVDDAIRPDLGQDLAVDFGLSLVDDLRDAYPLQDQRAADALLDVLTLTDDGDIGAFDPE